MEILDLKNATEIKNSVVFTADWAQLKRIK